MKKLLYIIIAILAITLSCKQKEEEQKPFVPSFSTYRNDSLKTTAPVTKGETYYGIMTPIEICVIFNRLNVPYSDVTLNPRSNKDLYLSNSKAALNTGVYGVDLGYLKMFGVGQDVINYLITIREMCNKLGIPDHFIIDPIAKLQTDMSNPDTVTSLMKKAYQDIENHLRESGRESTAGLMVMGGWIESMYIATQLVYDPLDPDPEVVQKIAEQKYTLTSLLSFMKNYYDDPVVVYYTKKLQFLKYSFDSFEIVFEKGDLEIDTVKQILRSSGSSTNITVETLNHIRDYIAKLRAEIVTP